MIKVNAPASKSVSHRALIAAALAPGTSRVAKALESDDIRVTRGCLVAMGAVVSQTDAGLDIQGLEHGPRGGDREPARLPMGESGTSARLLTAVAAAGSRAFEVTGAERMCQRPMGGLTRVLEDQGVHFSWLGSRGYMPFIMDTEGLAGGEMAVSLAESSQYLSGLLLAAPLARNDCLIGVAGDKVVSWPYVSLTLQVMEDFGVGPVVETLERGDSVWRAVPWREVGAAAPGRVRFRVAGGVYEPRDYQVEGDWSNASYFLAAGAVQGPVAVSGLRRDSVQGDRRILEILEAFGARVSWQGDTVVVWPGELTGQELDMGSCPDLVPTVAALAAFAKGPTTIRNVAHLRIKESDRLAAPAGELGKAGVGSQLFSDGLRIDPVSLPAGRSIEFSAHGDHRMAMSLSLLELAGVDVVLDDPGCVAKSFPGFFAEWDKVSPRTGRGGPA